MYEHGCQIWQIHLATSGGNINTQKKSAFDFTVELAMAYTSDNINKYGLSQRRCDKVEALGLGRPKRGGKAKRLVAASDGADLPGAGVSVAASDGGAHVLIAKVSGKNVGWQSGGGLQLLLSLPRLFSILWMICMCTAETRVMKQHLCNCKPSCSITCCCIGVLTPFRCTSKHAYLQEAQGSRPSGYNIARLRSNGSGTDPEEAFRNTSHSTTPSGHALHSSRKPTYADSLHQLLQANIKCTASSGKGQPCRP